MGRKKSGAFGGGEDGDQAFGGAPAGMSAPSTASTQQGAQAPGLAMGISGPGPVPPMQGDPMSGAGPGSAASHMLAANPGLASNPEYLSRLLAAAGPQVQAQYAFTQGATHMMSSEMPDLVDPDVQELCDHWHIEDRLAKRLSEAMKTRHDTWEGDLAKLWEVLETARNPAGLLSVKLREMEEGTFIGKPKPDKEIEAIGKKYRLDDQAKGKLMEALTKRGENRKDVLRQVEKHLEVSNRPSAVVMMLLAKLRNGEHIPDPNFEAAPGSYLDRMKRERESGGGARDRDRGGDRDRDRGGDRDRGNDRDRGDRGGDRDRGSDRRDERRRDRDRGDDRRGDDRRGDDRRGDDRRGDDRRGDDRRGDDRRGDDRRGDDRHGDDRREYEYRNGERDRDRDRERSRDRERR